MRFHSRAVGCLKSFLVPEVDAEIPFNTVLTNKEVLDVITLAAHDVKVASGRDRELLYPYMDKITYLNVIEGTLETGNYSKSNVTGIRLRAEIERDKQLIDITVKGVSSYYSKLPIDKGLQEIQMAITQQLTEAVAKNKK